MNGRSNLEQGAHISQFAAEGDRVHSGRENEMKLERVAGTHHTFGGPGKRKTESRLDYTFQVSIPQ